MSGFFTSQLNSNADSFVDALSQAIDINGGSDEERKALNNELSKAQIEYDLQIAALGLKTDQAYLEDLDSARKNQVAIQESKQASWLAKNIQPVLSIAIIGLTFWLYWLIIFNSNSLSGANQNIVIYILGALTTVSTQVASYYFGSSHGSTDKNQALIELAKK